MNSETIKVAVVDDSVVIRQFISKVLDRTEGIEVLYTSHNPILALKKMEQQWPDVIISDIEMPEMDGLTFLKKVMAERPTPVIIFSSATEKNVQLSIDAVEHGAFEVVHKPSGGLIEFLNDSAQNLIDLIHAAVKSNLKAASSLSRPAQEPPKFEEPKTHKVDLIAIGASTGGIPAIESVLGGLHPDGPPVAVVLHMPPGFTKSLAKRLNLLFPQKIQEATNGTILSNGMVILAPGGMHLTIRKNYKEQLYAQIVDTDKVNRHKPSVDVLFDSVARWVGSKAVGVLLTGMGDDGARGLKKMKDEGAYTIAQDKATSVVYGMPMMAMQMDAATRELPLEAIGPEINRYMQT